MKKLYILLFALITINSANAQGCLPEGIGFMSQTDIDNFQVNFPGCTEIEGNVGISGPDIINLHGLSVLTSIGGSLEFSAVNFLSDLTGLGELTSIGGNLTFHDTELIDMTGLGSLTFIGGNLVIGCLASSSIYCTNPLLVNLSGLEGLTYIGGQLYIGGCQSLTDVDALSSLNSVGALYIEGNSNLISLSGLGNIHADSIMYLTITGNDSLSLCDIPGICNFLNNPVGEINIYGNGTSCNNPSEIASLCGISLPCLPFGNYYILNQGDVNSFQDNFADCTDLEGNLVIGSPEVLFYLDSSNISDLSGLLSVSSIAGNLTIRKNSNLITLEGLASLKSVGGDFLIGKNDTLNCLIGLDSLTSIGGTLQIYSNYKLNSLSGLNNLLSIGSSLKISNNFILESFSELSNISTIGGDVYIRGNKTLKNLIGLENLSFIEGTLWISGNDSLLSLSALENLNHIGGDLSVSGNNYLINLLGLENVESTSITNLTITYNNLLSTCEVQSICNYLVSPNGNVHILGNAYGCNSQEEIEEACLVWVENNWNADNIILFPNPTDKKLNIANKNGSSISEVTLYNQTGQQVYRGIPEDNTLDISKIQPGMYVVEVVTKEGNMRKKLVVQ